MANFIILSGSVILFVLFRQEEVQTYGRPLKIKDILNSNDIPTGLSFRFFVRNICLGNFMGVVSNWIFRMNIFFISPLANIFVLIFLAYTGFNILMLAPYILALFTDKFED